MNFAAPFVPDGRRDKRGTMAMIDNREQEKATLFVATLTSFMGPFIISSVNVALPAIQQEFAADALQLNWIATALLLATAVCLVPAGRIGDIYGRKRVFAWGLTLFTLASILAGCAFFCVTADCRTGVAGGRRRHVHHDGDGHFDLGFPAGAEGGG
jgi:MFS family permease